MKLPLEAEHWSAKKRRWWERCYLCDEPCQATGRSVRILGRVCGDCYDALEDDAIRLFLDAMNTPPPAPEEIDFASAVTESFVTIE